MNRGLTLLFGMPRSGTTWIGKIFDSHPDTLYRHEPDSDGSLNKIPFFPGVDQWETHNRTVRDFVRRPVERLAWRWVLSNEKALTDIAPTENCTYVRYEDVCAEPFAKAWELLRFAGLSWHSQVKAFVQQSTSHHCDRYYSVFKDPAVAATQWRSQLSDDAIRRTMKIVHNSRLGKLYPDQNPNGKKSSFLVDSGHSRRIGITYG